MTTFHTGEQTHPSVLPQRQALEPMPADTPESRWGHLPAIAGGETGHRRANHRAPGVGHGRNEAKAARPIEEFLAHDPDLLGRIQRQAKRPLRDAAAMNATRWAVSDALSRLGVPVHAWSGGRTKFNRAQQGLAKSHTLDALAVGEIPPGTIITRHPGRALVVACTGRGRHQRTVPDRHGFPRLTRPRQKTFFGFTTGDLVRAYVRKGKHQGLHTGRVAVRSSGSFSVRTVQGLVLDTTHRRLQLLQRADGYGYTHRKEEGAWAPA